MKQFISLYFVLVLLAGCHNSEAQELIDQVDSRFDGVRSIIVEGVFCDVTVKPGDNSQVHLLGEIRGTRGRDDFSIEVSQNGSEIKVWVDHPNNIRGVVKGFLSFKVPDNVALKVKNVSGDVDVEKIGSDDMALSSVSGNINVSGAGSNILLESVSGDIDASLIAGSLVTKSVSGNIRVADVKGNFSGRSTSGGIRVRMVEGETSMKSTSGDLMVEDLMSDASLKTTSGSVEVIVSKGSLACKTVSGDVKLKDITGALNLSSVSGKQFGTEIMLTGNSSFNSISGDIRMELLNEIESLSFQLKSGSGLLKVGNSTADERLEISAGDILVKGSSTSGNQLFE